MELQQRIGKFFFVWRDKLPVPLVLLAAYKSKSKMINWILGLMLFSIGEALRIWALTHIGPKTRTRSICAEKLITSGPYSYCRNPLYLGNTLMIAGIMLTAGSFSTALLVALFYVAEFITMIPYEENFLAKQFPEAHKAYKAAVPAFVPTLKPNADFDGPANYSLSEAIKSEKNTFASSAAIFGVLAAAGLIKESKA